jgi:hypothetical protein
MNLQTVGRYYDTEVEIVTQNQDDLYNSQIRVNQEKSVRIDSGQTLFTVIRLTL